jgi:hypothetical protein
MSNRLPVDASDLEGFSEAERKSGARAFRSLATGKVSTCKLTLAMFLCAADVSKTGRHEACTSTGARPMLAVKSAKIPLRIDPPFTKYLCPPLMPLPGPTLPAHLKATILALVATVKSP